MTNLYFDFMEQYAEALSEKTYSGISKDIERAREYMFDDPMSTCAKARTILECVLDAFLLPRDKKNATYRGKGSIFNKVNASASYDLFSSRAGKQAADQIRAVGNRALHDNIEDSTDAMHVLIDLDLVLRNFIHSEIDVDVNPDVKVSGDVFIKPASLRATAVETKLRDNSENKLLTSSGVEAQFNKIKEVTVSKADADFNDFVVQLRQTLDENGQVVDYGRALSVVREKLATAAKSNRLATEQLAIVDKRIDEILSESDWIKRVLNGQGVANDAQRKAIDNGNDIVQLRGCAGSGKSLCLIAKAVKTVQEMPLEEQKGIAEQVVIFTFSKALATDTLHIIKELGMAEQIGVYSIDKYIKDLAVKKGLHGSIMYNWRPAIRTSNGHWIYSDMLLKAIENIRPVITENRFSKTNDTKILEFVRDEMTYIDNFKAMSLPEYQELARVGRGSASFNLLRNSDDRRTLFLIYEELKRYAKSANKFTIADANRYLLTREKLPFFEYVGIDEAQDLNMLSIEVLMRFAKERKTRGQVVIVGDENQKLFNGNFRWKDLGETITKANVETLDKNMRNTQEIGEFVGRLIGDDTPNDNSLSESSAGSVEVNKASFQELLKKLMTYKGEKLIVVNDNDEVKRVIDNLSSQGVHYSEITGNDFHGKNKYDVFVSNLLNIKGMEFDVVLFPFANHSEYYNNQTADSLQDKYYTAFSRARKRLIIGYQDDPNQILVKYYADYLPKDDSSESETQNTEIDDVSENSNEDSFADASDDDDEYDDAYSDADTYSKNSRYDVDIDTADLDFDGNIIDPDE